MVQQGKNEWRVPQSCIIITTFYNSKLFQNKKVIKKIIFLDTTTMLEYLEYHYNEISRYVYFTW